MIKRIHKVSDKLLFNAIFLIVIIWNLKYFFLPLQVPFTLVLKDFIWKNQFYSSVEKIKTSVNGIKGFQDEGQVGYISDVSKDSIFDLTDTIKSFYIVQYGIIPSVLKNDLEHKYVIADFEKEVVVPDGFVIEKKVDKNIFVLKRNKE